MTMKHLVMAIVVAVSFSFCDANARGTYLQKGEMAPYAGMLLDGTSELKVRTAIQQNDTYKEIIEDQYAMINNLHQDLKLKEAKIVILENNQENFTTKLLYFIGGALVGGMVVHKLQN